MSELQVIKEGLKQTRLMQTGGENVQLANGEISVKIDRFGFSANNITYGVAGDTLGYWKFFPPEEDAGKWGVIPVWGFADVAQSKVDGINPGERLFGYFPPASHLKMRPVDLAASHFFEGADHRSELPKAYNLYRIVSREPNYSRNTDALRMLLFPLYLTSFAIWDQLKENDWYGAEQIAIISASSKTAIGLAYALKADKDAPRTLGFTSKDNADFVKKTGLYDEVVSYDEISKIGIDPTALVDMAGNADLLGAIHQNLGMNMLRTLSVGLTHWETERRSKAVIKERTEFFFAPSRIQKRMKEWGVGEFNARSTAFVMNASQQSGTWLRLETLNGLAGLQAVFDDVREGRISPERGLIVEM